MRKLDVTKEKLIELSKEMILAKGFEFSIREFTSEASIGLGSFYSYFKDKDELINACLVSVYEEVFNGYLYHEFSSYLDAVSELIRIINEDSVKYKVFFKINLTKETNELRKAFLTKLLDTLLVNLNNDSLIRVPEELKEAIVKDTYTLCLAKLIKHESSESIIFLIKALY